MSSYSPNPTAAAQPAVTVRRSRRRIGILALLAVGTELFSRPGVHYVSGFFGPIERALRDMGADIEFAAADFRRFAPLLERQKPRVMTTVAAPPDADGWCSLSLHAGGTVAELRRAGADPQRLLIVEVSDSYPTDRKSVV